MTKVSKCVCPYCGSGLEVEIRTIVNSDGERFINIDSDPTEGLKRYYPVLPNVAFFGSLFKVELGDDVWYSNGEIAILGAPKFIFNLRDTYYSEDMEGVLRQLNMAVHMPMSPARVYGVCGSFAAVWRYDDADDKPFRAANFQRSMLDYFFSVFEPRTVRLEIDHPNNKMVRVSVRDQVVGLFAPIKM